MKGVKEVVPAQLEAIAGRALKQRAMGRIEQHECDQLISKLEDLQGFILNMYEKED